MSSKAGRHVLKEMPKLHEDTLLYFKEIHKGLLHAEVHCRASGKTDRRLTSLTQQADTVYICNPDSYGIKTLSDKRKSKRTKSKWIDSYRVLFQKTEADTSALSFKPTNSKSDQFFRKSPAGDSGFSGEDSRKPQPYHEKPFRHNYPGPNRHPTNKFPGSYEASIRALSSQPTGNSSNQTPSLYDVYKDTAPPVLPNTSYHCKFQATRADHYQPIEDEVTRLPVSTLCKSNIRPKEAFRTITSHSKPEETEHIPSHITPCIGILI